VLGQSVLLGDLDEAAVLGVCVARVAWSVARRSIEYPVDRILFSSASTRTAPTQNLVGAGGERRAHESAYSMYALWSPAGMAGWDSGVVMGLMGGDWGKSCFDDSVSEKSTY
jgi:hypothetical protein